MHSIDARREGKNLDALWVEEPTVRDGVKAGTVPLLASQPWSTHHVYLLNLVSGQLAPDHNPSR
jgi:hypothetical protein